MTYLQKHLADRGSVLLLASDLLLAPALALLAKLWILGVNCLRMPLED